MPEPNTHPPPVPPESESPDAVGTASGPSEGADTESSAAPAETPVAVAAAPPDAPGADAPKRPRIVLCPYCGHTQQGNTQKCGECGGLFEPLSRRATQIAMGPWSVRDKNHPFRPGCSYPVLIQMIRAGRITPTTVLRGPTTRQFWSIARNVPGVAHHLGYCHACGKHVSTDPVPTHCPHCSVPFHDVKTRNELGLQFPTRRAAESAQRSLNRLLGNAPGSGNDTDDGNADSPETSEDLATPTPADESDEALAAAAASASDGPGADPPGA
ncbi:MAG: hypothetical protein AAFX76_13900, partial [Planctomycetota bacterium]